MVIKVNDKPVEVSDGTNVELLLQQLGVAPRGTAVAINDKIAKRDNWVSTQIEPGDNVLIISAAYGG